MNKLVGNMVEYYHSDGNVDIIAVMPALFTRSGFTVEEM